MSRLYNVTIEYLGLKQKETFTESTICMGKDSTLLVMDATGHRIRFAANECRVREIAANVIIIQGYTDKPRYVTAYCIYADQKGERK